VRRRITCSLVLLCCAASSCTRPPVAQPPPEPVAEGVQVTPIAANAPQAASIDAPASGPVDDLQTYAAAVSRAIKARLVLPRGVPETASAVYEITLSAKGAVTELRAVRPSGSPSYDAAIRRAIERAQPFAPLAGADPANPIRLQLTFKVKD
jgi:TonB family protein